MNALVVLRLSVPVDNGDEDNKGDGLFTDRSVEGVGIRLS